MRQISLGPFVTCFLASIVLTGYLRLILNKTRGIFKYHAKIIFVLLAVVMIRMLVPINFPFTYSIYGTKIMNIIGKVIYFDLTKNIKVCDILFGIWACGGAIQMIRYFVNRKRVRGYLERYIVSTQDMERYRLNECIQESKLKNIRVACVPEKTMPAIFGALHPIIVLSKEILSCKDLNFIIRHEMQHYHNYDLHLKVLLDLLVMIHWWNPFIYGLRKKLDIAIEFSNDYMVSKELNQKEKIQYAESLLYVAKKQMLNGKYDLALVNNFCLEERIHLLIDTDFITERKKKVSMILNVLFLITVMLTTLVFVPEAKYSSEAEKVFEEEHAFSINSDNAYFMMTSEGYELYVSGKYITTFQKIPVDLEDISIYEQKNDK